MWLEVAPASVAVVLIPAIAQAQTIAGVVRDASGAVLPGVTVEAASPALIEKVRSAVTDGSGQYRLDSPVAGTYSVTYTLPGFTTVKREGVEYNRGDSDTKTLTCAWAASRKLSPSRVRPQWWTCRTARASSRC